MLVLFTDYGWHDPYVGQVKAVLHVAAPGVPVVDLLHAAPDFNAHAGAHLLDALSLSFPPGCVFLCVVDPGVGTTREAVIVQSDGRWFVGPDNGLLSVVAARGEGTRVWRITWRPEELSDTFHGRDLFAPIAGELAAGHFPEEGVEEIHGLQVEFDPADLARVLYIDHYGNAWTGLRGSEAGVDAVLVVKGQALTRRRTFSEAEKGEAFWYVNSSGMVEIAANRASAAQLLDLKVGEPVRLSGSPGNRLH
jgi:S-adenosylmethionine hydrolase